MARPHLDAVPLSHAGGPGVDQHAAAERLIGRWPADHEAIAGQARQRPVKAKLRSDRHAGGELVEVGGEVQVAERLARPQQRAHRGPVLDLAAPGEVPVGDVEHVRARERPARDDRAARHLVALDAREVERRPKPSVYLRDRGPVDVDAANAGGLVLWGTA